MKLKKNKKKSAKINLDPSWVFESFSTSKNTVKQRLLGNYGNMHRHIQKVTVSLFPVYAGRCITKSVLRDSWHRVHLYIYDCQ